MSGGRPPTRGADIVHAGTLLTVTLVPWRRRLMVPLSLLAAALQGTGRLLARARPGFRWLDCSRTRPVWLQCPTTSIEMGVMQSDEECATLPTVQIGLAAPQGELPSIEGRQARLVRFDRTGGQLFN